MKTKILKILILTVITLLVASEIFSWLHDVSKTTEGLISGVIIFAVYIYFVKKAHERVSTTTLLLMPVLICTVIPIGIRVYNFFNEDTSMIQNLPFVFSFVLPILLLAIVYFGLGKNDGNNQPIEQKQ